MGRGRKSYEIKRKMKIMGVEGGVGGNLRGIFGIEGVVYSMLSKFEYKFFLNCRFVCVIRYK